MSINADRYRAYNASGGIVSEGDVSGDAASFDAGNEVVASVVFYAGPVDEEAVCGSVLVNHSGPVSVTVPE